MTVIIGVVQDGKVYLGADSQITAGYIKVPYKNHPKIFRKGILMFASTGDLKDAQVVQHDLNVRDRYIDESVEDYIVKAVLPGLKSCITSASRLVENQSQMQSHFLCACDGELYEIYRDFSYIRLTDGFTAAGQGEDFALGALAMADAAKLPIKERIEKAAEVAAQYCIGVSGPFHIEEL